VSPHRGRGAGQAVPDAPRARPYADRFDSDDVLFRAVMLAAMLAIAALAVQIPDVAAGRHDAGFVVAYVILRSLLVALYLRAWPHAVAARPLIARYAGGYSLSIALWLLSLLVDPPLRYVLWGVGLAIEYAMPVVAQRIHARIPVDPSHVPERFGLFTIIVLGESVVAVALGDRRRGLARGLGGDRRPRLRVGRLPVVGVLRPRHGGRPQQPHRVDADLHAHPHPTPGRAHGGRGGRWRAWRCSCSPRRSGH
jgi:hypothetical protein